MDSQKLYTKLRKKYKTIDEIKETAKKYKIDDSGSEDDILKRIVLIVSLIGL